MKQLLTLLLFALGAIVTRAEAKESPHYSLVVDVYDHPVNADLLAAPVAGGNGGALLVNRIDLVCCSIGFVAELELNKPNTPYLMKEAEGVRQVLVKPPLNDYKRKRNSCFNVRIQNLLRNTTNNRLPGKLIDYSTERC